MPVNPLPQEEPMKAFVERRAAVRRKTSFMDVLQYVADCMQVIDMLVMAVAGYASYVYRYDPHPLGDLHAIMLAAGVLLYSLLANTMGVYDPRRMGSLRRHLVPFVLAHMLTLFSFISLLFFAHKTADSSRIWIGLWFSSAFIGMLLPRMVLLQWTLRKFKEGAYARRVVLVGGWEKTLQLAEQLYAGSNEANIVGICLTDTQEGSVPLMVAHKKVLPGVFFIPAIEELVEFARSLQVDEVIITSDLEHHPRATEILTGMEPLACSVKYCIPGQFFSRPLTDVELISHIPLVTIFRAPIKGRRFLVKRVMDLVLSAGALIILSPLLLAVAFAIALDGQGQVLFKQMRHGFGGEEFWIYKFRSMKVIAQPVDAVVEQAKRDDRRVTRVGAFIRRYSIDELPQLFNVLAGDMSLIGPRPHALSHNVYYQKMIASYAMRHRILPGITGFAQVNGWRGETDTIDKMQKRVENDLYYIENWSLWLDIKILVMTLFTLFGKNAY